jgi:hypothetical protein
MGMYDDITVKYPLPDFPAEFEPRFQTKDLENLFQEYEIREDGTLCIEEYDTVEIGNSLIKGIKFPLFDRVNIRWAQIKDFTGEIVFYESFNSRTQWIEYSSYFVDGKLKEIHKLKG